MRIDDLKTITLGSTGSGASVFNGTKMEPMMLRLWIIIRGNHGITGGDLSWRDFARRVLAALETVRPYTRQEPGGGTKSHQ